MPGRTPEGDISIKQLPTPIMIAITAPWVDPMRDQPFLASLGRLAPFIPNIVAAHNGLLTTQHQPHDNTALKALQKAADDADALHDRKLRGVYNLLGALADLSDDPVQTQVLVELQTKLAPEGLSVSNLPYAAEAGNAAPAAHPAAQAGAAVGEGADPAGCPGHPPMAGAMGRAAAP